tara:strand:+ start:1012 stop:1368 length:357 start_codon:yes stop_codon:yes gene_type:complete
LRRLFYVCHLRRNLGGAAMTYPLTPGAKGTDTSFYAADAIAPKASTLREMCKSVFLVEDSLTADEVADVLGQSILSIRPRITELSRLDFLEDSGDRRPNSSGKKAIVWRRKWKTDLFN